MTMTIRVAALAALACATSVQAHHSGSMYDSTPLWITGTVVQFDDINPHTVTTLEARSADGQVRRWAVEGPGRDQINRFEPDRYLPQIGDEIGYCAFPYKSPAELSRLFPDADFSDSRSSRSTNSSSPQYVAGHVMVMPDGEFRIWEPHGVISECMRSSDDPRETWLAFLDSNPRALQAWCTQQTYAVVQSSASLREFVDQINELIDSPCQ